MTHSPNPTAMSREALTWNPATVKPDVGRKIVCLYDDGSGAALFYTHDYGVIDSDGDEYAALTSDYSLWAYLPDDFELHCELHSEPGEHPMHLPVVRTAPQPPKAVTPSPDALRQALSYLTPHALTKGPVVLQADELRQAVETISAALARPVAEEPAAPVEGEGVPCLHAEIESLRAERDAALETARAMERERDEQEDLHRHVSDTLRVLLATAESNLAAAPKANGVGTGEEGVAQTKLIEELRERAYLEIPQVSFSYEQLKLATATLAWRAADKILSLSFENKRLREKLAVPAAEKFTAPAPGRPRETDEALAERTAKHEAKLAAAYYYKYYY